MIKPDGIYWKTNWLFWILSAYSKMICEDIERVRREGKGHVQNVYLAWITCRRFMKGGNAYGT